MTWNLFRSRKSSVSQRDRHPPAAKPSKPEIATLKPLAPPRPDEHTMIGPTHMDRLHRTPPLVVDRIRFGRRLSRGRFPLSEITDDVSTSSATAVRSVSGSSLRSSRSIRSGRSGRSNRSVRSMQRQTKAKMVALAMAQTSRDCVVCGRSFSGVRCDSCDTTYAGESPAPEGVSLDFELLFDLATAKEYALLEAVVLDFFSEVANVAVTFGTPGSIDLAAVSMLYEILGSVESTCPMRAVLQGAQTALQLRSAYAPITEQELTYILVVMACPAFGECSMFVKITGPLQKLARYASLRSRACVILEICCGLLAHAPPALIKLQSRYYAQQPVEQFRAMLELCNAYVGHRLNFHLTHKGTNCLNRSSPQILWDWYADDWRIAVVCKVLAAHYQAGWVESSVLPLSSFYNTMLDHVDLKTDFDNWQFSRGFRKKPRKFAFCQYPFLLSMGAKNKIFAHAVRREVDSTIQRELLSQLAHNPHAPVPVNRHTVRLLRISVRRTHLLQDSLAELNRWSQSQRRALRVEFVGEPGIDAGGPKKEWLLLFFRELLAPKLSVFEQDDDSNYCWFGPGDDHIDEATAAGIALGLALFNSVSIDLNLPPILFKMLLDAPYNLKDVAVLWPSLSRGLAAVLEYEGDDFEDVMGLTFSAPDGTPLMLGAPSVTLQNKHEYVKRLVSHLLERPGYAAFKRGFVHVTSGNAISLFEPEEIESLIRGGREPIDVPALRSVTKYLRFGARHEEANREPVVQWFWDYFASLSPANQAALLTFVTATDRVPATGVVNMRFRIECLGGDSDRLPEAHTCFNQLSLYRYRSRAKLERKLTMAIHGAQGFGIK